MGNEIIIESIEELQERWSYLRLQEGCEELLITEDFERGSKSFVVSGLSMELEDDYVICSDYKNTLLEKLSTLMLFLRDRLKSILLIPIEKGYRERLEFVDGIIYIEKNI